MDVSVRAGTTDGLLEEGNAARIRATAATLFGEQGFGATSMRQIARAVGITPGAIYNHFTSKEDLLNSIALGYHEELLEAVTAACAAGGTPGAILDRLVAVVTGHALDAAMATRASQREYANLREPHRRQVVELRERTLALVERVLAGAVASGELRLAASDPVALRRVATSVINMLVSVSDGDMVDGELTRDEIIAIHQDLVRRTAD